jgi:2-polyprenyl-3-methyl-5-hydroxy-6-metoxy-1,4-benzoquinol methylase
VDTNKAWKDWGNRDPYFGVLTREEFRRENLDDDALRRFFDSGEEHVRHVFEVLRQHFGLTEIPKSIVDYGCGTGRLALPFARRGEQVLGLDISAGMLDEARKNSERARMSNVEYRLVTDNQLSVLPESVDMIHSVIVFQHINRAQGELVFRALLSRLTVGGHGVMHFTLGSLHSPLRRLVTSIGNKIPALHPVLNLLRGKRPSDPRMIMESYSFPALIEIMHEAGIASYFCERINHSGCLGLLIYFKKQN